MKYSHEQVTVELLSEALPLLQAHYKEVGFHKDIELDVNFDAYMEADSVGAIRCFTARDEVGVLVGYNLFFINYHLHHSKSLQASQDVVYISKNRRGFGQGFIAWCDEQLKREGVEVVYSHIKASHDFGILLKRLDYELVDLVYARRLSDGVSS